MSGYALKMNAITFRTQVSVPEAVDVPSNAACLESYLFERGRVLRLMLAFARKIVTSELLDKFGERWPETNAVECWKKEIQDSGSRSLHAGAFSLWRFDARIDAAKNSRMRDDFMALLSAEPEFDTVTSIAYTGSNWERMKFERDLSEEEMQQRWAGSDFSTYINDCREAETGRLIYTKDTQRKILEWRPDLWWIPESSALTQVEQFIVTTHPTIEFTMRGGEYIRKRSFSAAATAIRFLEQMPSKQQACVRKLIVEEDHPSIPSPHTHARGFIAHCLENPQLQVERKLNIWPAVFVPKGTERYISTQDFLCEMCEWIREVKELRSAGMPDGSFALTIRGPTPEFSQHLCDLVTEAVTWQRATEALYRAEGAKLLSRYRVCEDFVELIDDVVLERIPVSFEGDLNKQGYDEATILRQHHGTWPRTFEYAFGEHALWEPENGWEDAREACIVEIDPADRLEWWNSLVDAM